MAGAVGEYTGNPVPAFLVGLLIHLILDAIPHYDSVDDGKWTKLQFGFVATDLVIGLLIIFLYLKPPIVLDSPFWWGALGGVIIDIFDVTPFWRDKFRNTRVGRAIHWFHDLVHQIKVGPISGLASQILVIIIAILLYNIKALI